MHIRHDAVHILAQLGICHGKQRIGAVYKRRRGTQRDECVHIRCPVPQAFKAADKKFLVDHHYYNG